MNHARRLFLVLIAVNVLLVVVILVVFSYATGASKKKSSEISDLKADIQSNSQELANYKALEKSLNNNKDVVPILQKALPSDQQQSVVLVELDKFAKETGFPLSQISFTSSSESSKPGTSAGLPGISTQSLSLSSGPVAYNNLLLFLKRIEANQRIMGVTSINITPGAGNTTQLSQTTMTVDIYYQNQTPKAK